MELCGLYAIVDPEHGHGHTPLTLTRMLLNGGCGALQLRAKSLSDEAFVELARAMAAESRQRNVPFFINDRTHLVRAANADGLHLGQNDMPVSAARALLPEHRIGLSTHSEAQAEQAHRSGMVDLIGVGPVFETRTKRNPDPVVGLETLRHICSRSPLPVVAIGGIDIDRAGHVFAAGAAMVAMISALSQAPDPRQAAAEVHAMYTQPDP